MLIKILRYHHLFVIVCFDCRTCLSEHYKAKYDSLATREISPALRMFKESENGVGGCNGAPPRPRRLFPRFSLRRLLYSSPLIGRRIARTPSASNRNTKGNF